MLLVLAGLASGCSHSVIGSESSAITAHQEESCDLAWGEPASTYDGVEGTYYRAGDTPDGEMKTMMLARLEASSSHIASEADSVRTFACTIDCEAESGRAQLLPMNPAFGATLSFSTNGFAPPDGAQPNVRALYSVLGIERGQDGRIAALCLNHLGFAPNAGVPFVMRR